MWKYLGYAGIIIPEGITTNAQLKPRAIIKNKIIGVTCHNSKKLIRKALREKVSYIALGSFYKSDLKDVFPDDLKVLRWAKKNIKKPIVVIGGITDKNYKKLIFAGANYIAISSFIWDNPFLKPEFARGNWIYSWQLK